MTVDAARSAQLDRYLRVIVMDARGGELLEIRYAVGGGGMRRAFVAADRADRAARLIASMAPRGDVYCGVLLRARRAGGRDAVADSRLLFVDVDRTDALERLSRFATPTMIVSSGTPGHAHAYWMLRARISPASVERANRALANHLGGDLASIDAARILRPAGTLSHKQQPPAAVELVHFEQSVRYDVDELVDGLGPPQVRPFDAGRVRSSSPRTELDGLLLAIPAPTYVRELAGLEPRRDGKVNCPFHRDERPSLQLYEDGTWCCFGRHGDEGRIGGSVYDFGGRLWSLDTKGREFLELRQRLAEALLSIRLGASQTSDSQS
jgi:hypothetical protein